jgi:hypothetical protein
VELWDKDNFASGLSALKGHTLSGPEHRRILYGCGNFNSLRTDPVKQKRTTK